MTWTISTLVGIAAAIAVAVIVRRSKQKLILPEQLQRLIGRGESILILDVRTPQEFNSGHIPGAVLVPHDRLLSSPGEIPRQGERMIIVYCERGPRARLAQNALIESGLSNVLHLRGDMSAWRARGLPVVVTRPERHC